MNAEEKAEELRRANDEIARLEHERDECKKIEHAASQATFEVRKQLRDARAYRDSLIAPPAQPTEDEVMDNVNQTCIES